MTKSHHSFNADETLTFFINELATKYNSKNEMFLDIFTKIQTKEIILGEPSIKEKQEVQKLENYKVDNTVKKAKILNLQADTEMKKEMSITMRSRLGNHAPTKKLIELEQKIEKNNYSKNPIHREGLMCIECGHIFVCTMDSLQDRQKCREVYADHIISKHKRLKLQIEEEVKLNEFVLEIELAS